MVQVARDWIDNSLNLASPKDVNLFETTIRVLGGLLSTYALSGDEVFKEKVRERERDQLNSRAHVTLLTLAHVCQAIELGDRLMPAFASKSGVPFSDVNLKSGHAHKPTYVSQHWYMMPYDCVGIIIPLLFVVIFEGGGPTRPPPRSRLCRSNSST